MSIHQKTSALSRTAAEYLVEQLAAWGCERIYGVAGDAILHLMDAIAAQDQIRYINCRLETTAALMASAEAKLTGRLAVCAATSGPGIVHMLNGLADAAQDRAPVLAITGQVERKKLGTGSKQDLNQQVMIEPLAVYSALTADARVLPVQLNLAMKKSISMGGVAHLSIPKDVWMDGVHGELYPPMVPQSAPPPPEHELQRAIGIMKSWACPVILAGRGVKGCERELLQLAEKWGAPIMTTLPAKSCVPHDHQLYIGGLGQGGSDIATELLREADGCLILGATWWPQEVVPAPIPVIQVDARPENIGDRMPITAAVAGGMSSVLPQMIREIGDGAPFAWLQRVQELKGNWKSQLEREAKLDTEPIAPQRVVAALHQVVEADAIMALDVGDHLLWFNRVFQAKKQEILISGRWRTLGFGLPAAMAAKLAEPERQVVVLAGDGGFGTTWADLITAVAYKLPISIILINNGVYAMERNRMIKGGLKTLGGEVNSPDFVQMAEAFGAEGYRVEQTKELEPALRAALASREVSLVDVRCDDTIVPHTKL
ncbi:pyruvate dehydrogenase (quinone)/pyruvate oxidase [Kroppenstedtia sanguinis]|uniref:thiamine pyrophosphate-binding protein n=1 Tax=Kroppenstedtia sanguinis TaxID=1380684 RepID=UPI003D1B580A